ncbi:hypothetical protein NEMIN01_1948 [Nematocida minor]|uniref:uncharacterized protein n=1 Tax=Nematocida minor TaxID=1912983 RepID=UPI0022211123|nr:uncharacterized protein NEMIN01_1948 [Nematocida minor]KAI5192319.1 hypothetical protein NEMIN01_1948 [Nematocida minor]
MCTKIGVIVDFVTQQCFVIQVVCAKTGKALEREKITQKNILLTSHVIEFDDSEEERGAAFVKSVEENIRAAVEEKQAKECFQKTVRLEERKEMNDFERFMKEQEDLARIRILNAHGFE